MNISIPEFLIVLLDLTSKTRREQWRRLEKNSDLMGRASETFTYDILGTRWTVTRWVEVKRRANN